MLKAFNSSHFWSHDDLNDSNIDVLFKFLFNDNKQSISATILSLPKRFESLSRL